MDQKMDNKQLLTIALDLDRREVIVKEWKNYTCYIRELTALEMDKFSDVTYELKDGILQAKPIDAMVNILSFCLIGEDDKTLFTIKQLQRMSAATVLELGLIAFEVNNLDNISLDSNKALKEAADNLKNGSSDTSTSS